MEINEFKLLLDIAYLHANDIAEDVIETLHDLEDEMFLLLGADSGLKSVWEEICVQMQDEESIHWDVYQETINAVIQGMLDEEPHEIKYVLNYVGSVTAYHGKVEDLELLDEFGVKLISDRVLNKACYYTNDNITNFFERRLSDGEDEEEDEDL